MLHWLGRLVSAKPDGSEVNSWYCKNAGSKALKRACVPTWRYFYELLTSDAHVSIDLLRLKGCCQLFKDLSFGDLLAFMEDIVFGQVKMTWHNKAGLCWVAHWCRSVGEWCLATRTTAVSPPGRLQHRSTCRRSELTKTTFSAKFICLNKSWWHLLSSWTIFSAAKVTNSWFFAGTGWLRLRLHFYEGIHFITL